MIAKLCMTVYRSCSNGKKLIHITANRLSDKSNVDENNFNKNSTNNSSIENKINNLEFVDEPTTCCMSGCANCVWLDYAEALCKQYQDGGEKAIREINEKITDPNTKAYILHEIRMRNK